MPHTEFFRHDTRSFEDEKLIDLFEKHGYEGYGLYWRLLELLYSSQSNKIVFDLERLSRRQFVNQSLLNSVICDFDLFEFNEKYIWNNRVLSFATEVEIKIEKARESSNVRWNKDKNANDMRTDSDRNTTKLNKTKVNKSIYSECVLLTKNEYEKLTERFGIEDTKEKIERLNDYVLSKGVKYKSHYHTILTWAKKDEPKDKIKFLNIP